MPGHKPIAVCRARSTANGRINTASVTSAGCRLFSSASTMSAAATTMLVAPVSGNRPIVKRPSFQGSVPVAAEFRLWLRGEDAKQREGAGLGRHPTYARLAKPTIFFRSRRHNYSRAMSTAARCICRQLHSVLRRNLDDESHQG